MKKTVILSLLFALVLSQFTFAHAEETSVFKDIKGHWAEKIITDFGDKGIVNGFPDGTFKPNQAVTTAEFIVMLLNSVTSVDEDGVRRWSEDYIQSLPRQARNDIYYGESTRDKNSFTMGTPWYANYVNVAKGYGFIGRMQFEPYGEPNEYSIPLTREKAASIASSFALKKEATIVKKYAELGFKSFKDQHLISPAYEISVGEAAILGIMGGLPDGSFSPKGYMTRAEALTVIARIHDPSLRKPLNIDISAYPHRYVPSDPGGGRKDYIHFFKDFTDLRIYEDLVANQNLSRGYFVHDGAGFIYYSDEESLQLDQRDLRERIWDWNTLYWDLVVGVNGFMTVTVPERIEPHKDVINAHLKSVFGTKADEVETYIYYHLDRMVNERHLKFEEEKVFGNYTVKVMYFYRGGSTDWLDVFYKKK